MPLNFLCDLLKVTVCAVDMLCAKLLHYVQKPHRHFNIHVDYLLDRGKSHCITLGSDAGILSPFIACMSVSAATKGIKAPVPFDRATSRPRPTDSLFSYAPSVIIAMHRVTRRGSTHMLSSHSVLNSSEEEPECNEACGESDRVECAWEGVGQVKSQGTQSPQSSY